MATTQKTLSERGHYILDRPLRGDLEVLAEAERNLYDAERNPGGALLLAVAENVLSWPELRDKLAEISATRVVPDWVAKYTSIAGAPPLREALARFAGRHIANLGGQNALALDPEGFAVSSGATGVVELCAWCLGDPGEVAVFPAPSYPAYRADVENKAGLERFDLVPREPFAHGIHPLRTADLERVWAKLTAAGKRFRMLVLTQPDNPTGSIYRREQLISIADWCIAHEVHLCVNELYALSQLDVRDTRLAADYPAEPAPYYSFLREVERRRSPYLHWWYSFSKDFGVSGLRTGVLYSRNEALLRAIGNLGAPHTVSNHTQWLLSELLADHAWVAAYAKTNQARLTESYAAAITVLREHGIPYAAARGSLFVWMRPGDPGGDTTKLWRKLYEERHLVLTAPGGFGHVENGWLRLVYSGLGLRELGTAMARLVET